MVAADGVAAMIHIHNGDVVAALARRSGIPGEQFVFRESLVSGPVVLASTETRTDWIERRARALAEFSSDPLLRVRTDLLMQEQALDAAVAQDEVVLWFEHDLYCLIHLIYLLDRLSSVKSGVNLSLVWSAQPLAGFTDEEMYRLYESRSAVKDEMRKMASEAWADYTDPDASKLNRWRHADAGFTFLREGMRLHATRFPSLRNGLGAIEERSLAVIAEGASHFAAVFDVVNAELPRFTFGDTAFAQILQRLVTCPVPLLTMMGEYPKATFAITQAGERVLRGDADHLDLNPPDQWLGGVHLTTEDLWRYDGTQLIRSAVL
jgi:hypothetical protein